MNGPETSWNAWLGGLDAPKRASAMWLKAQFEMLGADDPGAWARSEIGENRPHLARYMLLKAVWTNGIDGWADPGALEQLPAAARLLEHGADRVDLVRLARAAAYEAAFAVLGDLDAGGDVNVSGVDVGWTLIEAGEDGSPTGRPLSGLHEDLLSMDPSGREGADLCE